MARQRAACTITTPLATGLLAVSLSLPLAATPALAHAQASAAGLAARDRAAFRRVWPSVQQCSADLNTVTGDLQRASGNLGAGDADTGSLGRDGTQMRNDCLAAAARVNRLHFAAGARHTAARRVKAELHAALVELAQGAADCTQIAQDLAGGDVDDAVVLLQRGASAWKAAAAHMRVVTSYVH